MARKKVQERIKDYLERFEILDGCSVIRINDLDLSNYPVHDCSIEPLENGEVRVHLSMDFRAKHTSFYQAAKKGESQKGNPNIQFEPYRE